MRLHGRDYIERAIRERQGSYRAFLHLHSPHLDLLHIRPRLKYALLRTIIVPKTTTGEKTFSAGEVSGAVGGGFISRVWQPARLHTFASGAGSAGIALGVDAGFNVAREFWPEIRHPKRARARQTH